MSAFKFKNIIVFSVIGLFYSSGLLASAAAENVLKLISAAHTANPNGTTSQPQQSTVTTFSGLTAGQTFANFAFLLKFSGGTQSYVWPTTGDGYTLMNTALTGGQNVSVTINTQLVSNAWISTISFPTLTGSPTGSVQAYVYPSGTYPGAVVSTPVSSSAQLVSTSLAYTLEFGEPYNVFPLGSGPSAAAPLQTVTIVAPPVASVNPAPATTPSPAPSNVPSQTVTPASNSSTFSKLTAGQAFANFAFLLSFSDGTQSYVWPTTGDGYTLMNTALTGGQNVSVTINTQLVSNAWISTISFPTLTGSPTGSVQAYVYPSGTYPGAVVSTPVSSSAQLVSTSLAYTLEFGEPYNIFPLGSGPSAPALSQTVTIVAPPVASVNPAPATTPSPAPSNVPSVPPMPVGATASQVIGTSGNEIPMFAFNPVFTANYSRFFLTTDQLNQIQTARASDDVILAFNAYPSGTGFAMACTAYNKSLMNQTPLTADAIVFDIPATFLPDYSTIDGSANAVITFYPGAFFSMALNSSITTNSPGYTSAATMATAAKNGALSSTSNILYSEVSYSGSFTQLNVTGSYPFYIKVSTTAE